VYLTDTNILILAIDGQEPEASFLRRAVKNNAVRLSVISVAEFLTGTGRVEQRAFEKLMLAFPPLIIDKDVARLAADYRKKSLKKTRVTLLDCLLAAQAKKHGLTLVTNNKADFPMRDILIMKP